MRASGKYEESLLAALYPIPCGYCGRAWTCGQDVHERKAILHGGLLLCRDCILPPDSALTDWLMSQTENLSKEESQFAARVAGLRDDELEVDDSNRIIDMMERMNG